MSDEKDSPSWWTTLPGIITAVAGLLTAVGGLLLVLNTLGMFEKPKPSANQPTESPEVIIQGPVANARIQVKTDGGAAIIPVTGTLKGFLNLSEIKVYVLTRSPGDSEWWFHDPVSPDRDGSWSAEGLFGSKEKPASTNQIVNIRVAAATDKEIQEATKTSNGQRSIKNVNLPKNISMQLTVTITTTVMVPPPPGMTPVVVGPPPPGAGRTPVIVGPPSGTRQPTRSQ